MSEIKILEESQNPLFKRKEIKFTLQAEITPSKDEISKLISEKFSTTSENIKIKKIDGKFGEKVFTITANIYESSEELNQVEVKTKKQREAEKKAEEEKLKAEREAKAEEAKVEEEKIEEEKLAEESIPDAKPSETNELASSENSADNNLNQSESQSDETK